MFCPHLAFNNELILLQNEPSNKIGLGLNNFSFSRNSILNNIEKKA
jgi:hypothetical protein